METMPHTPGPWRVIPWTDGANYTVEGGHGQPLANVTGANSANEANARLIAQAPAMLDALRQAVPLLVTLGDFIGNGEPDPARPRSLGLRCDLISDARTILRAVEEG